VDQKLAAAVEEVGQRHGTGCLLEGVRLVEPDPGEFPTLPGKVVAESI